MKKAIIGLMAMVILAACSEKAAEKPGEVAATARHIAQGEIIGTTGRDGAWAWYGIPYAAPPVGDLRWRAPRPPAQFAGRFSATDFSHKCPQFAGIFNKGHAEDELLGSEDCLYLNVWAPAGTKGDAELPVMLWIHGGANTMGYAGQYEMGRLATRGGVVVVSVNYRLGPLGWFVHQSLRDTAEQPLDRTGNFGTLDLVSALDWTRANVAAFGGNPDNITIFGESAGAVNVATLLASPLARGKFQRAIMESGSFSVHTLQEAEYGPAREEDRRGHASREAIPVMAEAAGADVAGLNSPELAEWLRTRTVAEVLGAFVTLNSSTEEFGGYDSIDVTADGMVIPKEGVEALLADPSRYNDVPLIMGTNRDEVRVLGMFEEGMTRNLWLLARWPTDPEFYELQGEVLSSVWRASSVDEPAKQITAGGNDTVYSYRFDWDEQGSTLFNDMSQLMGAMHSLEIAFVTGGFDDPVNDPFGVAFSSANQQERELLSDRMMSYWAQFAHTGAPGRGLGGGLPGWRPWATGGMNAMVFDTDADGGVRMMQEHLTVTGILEDLASDPRAETDAERCMIVVKARELFVSLASDIEPFVARFCGESVKNDQK